MTTVARASDWSGYWFIARAHDRSKPHSGGVEAIRVECDTLFESVYSVAPYLAKGGCWVMKEGSKQWFYSDEVFREVFEPVDGAAQEYFDAAI